MELKLEECLEKINKNREKVEAPFVFCLWKDPDLFDDYKKVNIDGDETIKTEDGRFYFELGRALYDAGYRTFDNLTVSTFLEDKPTLKEGFQERGGYHEVNELKQLVDTENIEAYYDKIAKLNILNDLCKMNFKMFSNIKQFNNMSSQNIYDLFEYQLNNVSLAVEQDMKIEDLTIDDDFIRACNDGEAVGLSYSDVCPGLSSTTLGLPMGDMFMIGGHSGCGKSSFIFEAMILSLNNKGYKTAIISNEMQSDAYKNMLIVHVLTHELDYWGLTRKKMKQGHFDDEQMRMIKEAQKIIKEKYSNIKFVKMFDTDNQKVCKLLKKLARQGYSVICFDTLKCSDTIDNSAIWSQLLMDSRRLFQTVSKDHISLITTYQLALHTTNLRFLDATALSNSKQIKEVYSEMVYFRHLWDDEKDKKSKYYCKPFKLKKTRDGSYIKKEVQLDPEKDYLVAFVDKTRNDEGRKQFLYEWNSRYNRFYEVAQVAIVNEHKGY